MKDFLKGFKIGWNWNKTIYSIGPVEVTLSPIAWDTIADNMRRMSSIKIVDASLMINGIDSGQDVEVILRKIAI